MSFVEEWNAFKFVLMMGLFNSEVDSCVGAAAGVLRTVVELTPKIRFTHVHNMVSENDRKTDVFNKNEQMPARRKFLRRCVNRRDPYTK